MSEEMTKELDISRDMRKRPIPLLKSWQRRLFWKQVRRGYSNDCWEWIGPASNRGYGSFYLYPTTFQAHRVAFSIANGSFPPNAIIAHRCDNPICVNPAHLFCTNQKGNVADAVQKRRAVFGERAPMAKLTAEKVLEIRRRYQSRNGAALAREFGIRHSTLYAILSRKTWRHI